jgi:hypothetical protein
MRHPVAYTGVSCENRNMLLLIDRKNRRPAFLQISYRAPHAEHLNLWGFQINIGLKEVISYTHRFQVSRSGTLYPSIGYISWKTLLG